MDIDRGDLATFVKVWETRSFSKAAQMLFCTQSAVSRRIQRLETQVGSALFDRSTQGLRPTMASERLFELADNIENLFLKVERLAQDESLIRLGTTTSIATCLLPDVIAYLRREGILVHVTAGHSADIVTALLERRIDLGIVLRPPKSPQIDWHPWDRSPLVAVSSVTNVEWVEGGWTAMPQAPLILYVFGPEFWSFRDRIRMSGAHIVVDNASPSTLVLQLLEHEGLSFMPLAAIPSPHYAWNTWPELSAYGWDLGMITRAGELSETLSFALAYLPTHALHPDIRGPSDSHATPTDSPIEVLRLPETFTVPPDPKGQL